MKFCMDVMALNIVSLCRESRHISSSQNFLLVFILRCILFLTNNFTSYRKVGLYPIDGKLLF
jgi:hypothetical protein